MTLIQIHIHYYTIRMIISFFIAIVARHTLDAFSVRETSVLVLISFVIGLSPDLFILSLARKAYETIEIYGLRSDPTQASRPASMPLLMLDDFSRAKIDRLGELDIDNAHTLAYQNPFVIWSRLPYELNLIVDWIAQAQHYMLVREDGLAKLRAICVNNIFQFYCRLKHEESSVELMTVLGITTKESVPAMIDQVDLTPAFAQLQEVGRSINKLHDDNSLVRAIGERRVEM
jgi:hypothetical protein